MIHLLIENNILKNRRFKLPDGILKKLNRILNSYHGDKTIDGYKRLNNIIKMDSITYNELKRIKNFFDNFKGNINSYEYILNGGEEMKLWVNNTLRTATKAVKDYKQTQKDNGVANAFIKPHTKERQITKNKPTQVKFQTNNFSQNISNAKTLKYENRIHREKLNENDILKYIPKRVYNAINKFNQELEKQQQYMDDEYCLKDTDGNDYKLTPIVITDKGEMEYDIYYQDAFNTHYHENIPLLKEYEGEIWFDDEEYKSYMKQYKSDLKRAARFFVEYGAKESDYDDDGEENVMKRLNNECKSSKTVIISEEQLRYYLKHK